MSFPHFDGGSDRRAWTRTRTRWEPLAAVRGATKAPRNGSLLRPRGRSATLSSILAPRAVRHQCDSGVREKSGLDEIWRRLETRRGKSRGTREMIELVRAGLCTSWPALIAAVEQALSLGVSDAAAVHHILAIPDPMERRRHQLALAAELAEFERPLPGMDDYDLLLSEGAGGVP